MSPRKERSRVETAIDGIARLSVLVKQALQRSPCAGSAFVFCNRTGNRIKALLWDGTGMWLCQRRLQRF
ncbi:MAG: IS66 family insertion sequence element accessory protein TnpB [Nitrosomonas sp.]|uniref:IS66 family insertion sequence element accessory protein TnpB n=1 Tax=Nitrosomonas sp. TaxID=42353 RepID=UPI001D637270|nr:IS66 family insertion sequence element accessory protein TnpB [Nitrosomonas sp.]MBX9896250.1 IS66 family insertion sequence element accessory protein TnpB [Nitrosomonas sp.]